MRIAGRQAGKYSLKEGYISIIPHVPKTKISIAEN
jgi:hypothetical protein